MPNAEEILDTGQHATLVGMQILVEDNLELLSA